MVSTKRKNTTPVLLAPAQVLSIKTSLQNSVCLPTQGRGELNEKKLNLTSPWKNLSRRYLFMSESLDRTDPCRRRHAQPCENKCSENSHPETRLRNTSHILFLSLSMCLCQTVSCYCLTHAHKHKPELSNKAYPVISLRRLLSCSLCLLGRLTVLIKHNAREKKTKKHNNSSSIRSEPESSKRRTNSSNFYQLAG